jgi:hypothetical protein
MEVFPGLAMDGHVVTFAAFSSETNPRPACLNAHVSDLHSNDGGHAGE